ncbi:hypothetical protein [Rhizobium leguminosarum]|uniref:hypothetical protein n=1 Tax=Rhizobium leguminosarum TaxID=384 RepID=UPI003F9E31AE
MANEVRDLQQLAEAKGGASTMDWSTISHTHGGGPTVVEGQYAALSPRESIDFIKQLQQLPQAGDASPMEWSTISHTHGGPK